MKKLAIALILTLTSIAVKADPRYFAETEILRSGELLGTPSLLLELGEDSEIRKGQIIEGEDSWDYKLILSASSSDTNDMFLKVTLDVDGEEISESKLMELGKKTEISNGSLSLFVELNQR